MVKYNLSSLVASNIGVQAGNISDLYLKQGFLFAQGVLFADSRLARICFSSASDFISAPPFIYSDCAVHLANQGC